MSYFGGVHNSTSNLFAHDNLLDVGDDSEGEFNAFLYSSHVSNATIFFDVSCDEEENNECCQSEYGFSLCADKYCKDKFKVHSDILLDE